MRRSVGRAAALLALLLAPLAATAQPPGGEPRGQVEAILSLTPLIDGHNDLPDTLRRRLGGRLNGVDLQAPAGPLEGALHTDLQRLRRGSVGGQFWSVYVSADLSGADATVAVLEQIDLVKRLVALYPDRLELALSASEIEQSHARGRVACLIGMEGGNAIAESLAVLRQLHAAGARYLTLTHALSLRWADAATDAPRSGGLSPFGREVVREMNRLGMLVDLSHTAPTTMHDALDVSVAPVIFSHSSARALCDHVRNVPDDVLSRLPDNGGIAMVTFVPGFVSEAVRQWREAEVEERTRLATQSPGEAGREAVQAALAAWRAAHPAPRASLAQVADHIEHVRCVAGVDHVGIGSDFDGITSTPDGLEDVAAFPELLRELMRRGWCPEDVAKVAGGNILRVLRQAGRVAAELQRQRPPSEATLDDLDRPAVKVEGDHAGGRAR